MRPIRFAAGLSAVLALAPAVFADPLVCTSGELFAGAPDYSDPTERAADGQGLRDVPPLGFRTLAFAGDRLVTTVGPELWYADLAAASPVLKRFAGRESSKRETKPGKCAQARFGNVSGLAVLPDGSLAGADQMANLVFVVTDPFGPDCSVAFIVGATEPQPSLNPGSPPSVGDADGPGADVLLRGPDWVAALDDGVIYFIDTGNAKLKRVLTDPERTVETVAALPEGAYYALITLDGKLYAVANNDIGEGFLLEIGPATGEMREILRGRSDIWLSQGSINVSGLATDGVGLITSQSGQVLYVTLEGDITSIAGSGKYTDLEPGYDPLQSHPAAELQLWSRRRTMIAGANVFLGYRDGKIYYVALGETAYVVRIDCP